MWDKSLRWFNFIKHQVYKIILTWKLNPQNFLSHNVQVNDRKQQHCTKLTTYLNSNHVKNKKSNSFKFVVFLFGQSVLISHLLVAMHDIAS